MLTVLLLLTAATWWQTKAQVLEFTPEEIQACKAIVKEETKQAYGTAMADLTSGLTHEQECIALLAHNKYRKMAHGSNIYALKWDAVLANTARIWAETCWFNHGRPKSTAADEGGELEDADGFSPVTTFPVFDWEDPTIFKKIEASNGKYMQNPDGGSTGQNLVFKTGSVTAQEVDIAGLIHLWDDEKRAYDLNAPSKEECNTTKIEGIHTCGHWTQEVWAQTEYVGCGFHQCPELYDYDNKTIPTYKNWKNANYLVCHYFTGGNFWGVKPYTEGVPCSDCTDTLWCDKPTGLCASDLFCKDELSECECDSTKYQPLCGGTFNTATCRCQCPVDEDKGIVYTGNTCSGECKDGSGYKASCESWLSTGLDYLTYKAFLDNNCCYTFRHQNGMLN